MMNKKYNRFKIRIAIAMSLFFLVLLVTNNVLALSESLILDNYIVDISYNEDDVVSGDSFRIDMTITNDGDEARSDVELNLDLGYPFDEIGDDSKELGDLDPGDSRSVTFRIDVDDIVEEDDYEVGVEVEDDDDSDSDEFFIEVESNRAELIVADFLTMPGVISPNMEDVRIKLTVENTGEKDAKSAEIILNMPEGFEPSFSNNNRFYIGKLMSGESREVEFFVDVDEETKSGTYDFNYEFSYLDEDDNDYHETETVPFLVKSAPYLEVVKVKGEGNAGSTGKLYITIKNTGEESAEAVDVRILKQNSQPFNFDVRSDYIGELQPGETGIAIFDIDATSDAELKTYNFKILIRAKGDSDTGDDNIYTFNRRADYRITGDAPNYMLYIGLISFPVLLTAFLIVSIKGGMKK